MNFAASWIQLKTSERGTTPSAGPFDSRRDREKLVVGIPRRRLDVNNLGVSDRQGPGLVKHDDIKLSGHLERGRILKQNSIAGSEAG